MLGCRPAIQPPVTLDSAGDGHDDEYAQSDSANTSVVTDDDSGDEQEATANTNVEVLLAFYPNRTA